MYSENDYSDNFTALYEKFYSSVTGYFFRKHHNIEIAKEMAQDIFMKIYEKKVYLSAKSPQSIKYLFRCAKNHSADLYRRRKNAIKSESIDKIVNIPDNSDLSGVLIEQCLIEDELFSVVNSTLEKYDSKQRMIYISSVIKNKSLPKTMQFYRKRKKIVREINRILKDQLSDYKDFIS